ncbi:MAG TPA: hypothetical protein ENN40_05205 [Candidatus Aminicenantes bacterium]|nr:hypothetical protein [Candidatus Aminicenantes bacterium]
MLFTKKKQIGLNCLKKASVCLLMLLTLILSLESATSADSAWLKNKLAIGIGLAGFYQGLISVPAAQSTGSGPAFDLFGQRESGRLIHSLNLSFGRAGSVNRAGRVWPGENSFSWMPLQYSLTSYSRRNAFGLEGLSWGIGATVQWFRLREELEWQAGQRAGHHDDLLGLGLNTGFRWRPAGLGAWRAMSNISLSLAIPPLNRSAYRSKMVPDHEGGAFWGAVGFVLSVERSVSRRWSLGLLYQRQALFLLRTLEKRFSFAEMYSAGNFLFTQLALRIGYRW